MLEKVIIRLGIIFGILSFPTLFKRPSYKIWLPFFIWNVTVNIIFDTILVRKRKVKYPIRYKPKATNINIIYDVLVCPYLSIWYCQSSYNDSFPQIIKKLFYWGVPQSIYEIWLERKTDALKFKKGYGWYHSLFLVFIVKILSRSTLELLKLSIIQKKNKSDNPTMIDPI